MAFTPAVISAVARLPLLTTAFSVLFMISTAAKLALYARAVYSTLPSSRRRAPPVFTPSMLSDTLERLKPVTDITEAPTAAVPLLADAAATPGTASTSCRM